MYQEIEDCLTEGQCELCGGLQKCPLDDKLFNFLTENNFDPNLLNQYHSVKAKYSNYSNKNDYSSCIFLSEIKRN